MEWHFYDDPEAFLHVAAGYLAEDPVLTTVVSGIAHRLLAEQEAGIPWDEAVPKWFATLDDGGRVVGAAMRTAPFGNHPAYLLPVPDDEVLALARILLERDEPVLGANGALPAVQVFCEEMARATGQEAEVLQHTRLFEVRTLVEPTPAPGRLRAARPEEQDIVTAWFEAFMADADVQAGREPGSSPHEAPPPASLRERIARQQMWLWEDAGGTPVHLTGVGPPAFGVSRIGPVYTPVEQRGRGYAGSAVAQVSRQVLERGDRACLFTDQANPTSNKLYEKLGYRPVVDMANLQVG